MSRRPIEISVYTYQPRVAIASAEDRFFTPRALRAIRNIVAATLCFMAHAFLLRQMMFGDGASAPSPHYLPARISVSSENDQEALQWIALDPHALTDPAQHTPELPSVHLRKIDVTIRLDDVAVLVQDVDLPSTENATVADAARLSKMYGLYVGQINSRVERAWVRPRTPVGAPVFSCQVRVSQDAAGNVLEVTLVQCNGDTRWQVSLVQAIQSASPLPAPPDPDVFTSTLHLAFRSEPYSPHNVIDQYEPDTNASIVQAAEDTERANNALVDPVDLRRAEAIRLSITGNRKTVHIQNATSADPSSSARATGQ